MAEESVSKPEYRLIKIISIKKSEKKDWKNVQSVSNL